MSEIPGWPDDLDSMIVATYALLFDGMIACDAVMNHERALRLAWEARCRVAIEALGHCIDALDVSYDATEWPANGSSRQERTSAASKNVIAAIGPLPERR